MSGIIWLASYPKSGNTWLRAFLANYVRNSAAPVPINELRHYVLGDGFHYYYESLSGKPMAALTGRDIARLRPLVHQRFAASSDADVFVKTHNLITRVDGCPLITPAATVGGIYVARNPLDVAVSLMHHFQVSADKAIQSMCAPNHILPQTEDQLIQYLGSWTQHVTSWLDARGLKLHVMRYEDMVHKPGVAFGALLQFLGVAIEPARMQRALSFSSFGALKEQEDTAGFVESRPDGKASFFRQGGVGGWREVLGEEQANDLIAGHGPAMTRLGYLSRDGSLTDVG